MSKPDRESDARPRPSGAVDPPAMHAAGAGALRASTAPSAAANDNDLAVMRRLDELFLAHPFLGSRRMAAMLRRRAGRSTASGCSA